MKRPPREATLVNAAGKVTRHEFVRKARVKIGGETSHALIFRCTETGAERRWGLDDPKGPMAEDDDGAN